MNRTLKLGVLCALALTLWIAPPLLAASKGLKEGGKKIKAGVRANDFTAIDDGIYLIREVGGKKAADVLLGWAKKIPAGQDALYWRFVNGASALRDEEGLTQVGKAALKGGTIGRDVLYAMQNNRGEHVPLAVHRPILLKGAIDLALMSADQLGSIERLEAVDALIDGLAKREKKGGELERRIQRGLRRLTGADCGVASDWSKWWEGARSEGLQGSASRGKSTGTVVDRRDDWDEMEALEKLSPGKILVMTTECDRQAAACNFDNIGGMLTRMNIPFTAVTKQQFEKGEISLKGVVAILLTCTQINEHCTCPKCVPSAGPKTNRMTQCTNCDVHILTTHKLSATAVKKIKEWVERGGYLFTEDWGMKDLVAPAWPKIVKSSKMLKSRSARVTPGRGNTSHPLLRGVFLNPDVAKKSGSSAGGGTVTREPSGEPEDIGSVERFWTIDDESPLIEIVARTGVTVLMSSQDLVDAGGPKGNAVAITFLPAGAKSEKSALHGKLESLRGGRVLHVLSHFAKQKSDEDAFALQNLLLNFLSEAQRRAPR